MGKRVRFLDLLRLFCLAKVLFVNPFYATWAVYYTCTISKGSTTSKVVPPHGMVAKSRKATERAAHARHQQSPFLSNSWYKKGPPSRHCCKVTMQEEFNFINHNVNFVLLVAKLHSIGDNFWWFFRLGKGFDKKKFIVEHVFSVSYVKTKLVQKSFPIIFRRNYFMVHLKANN